MKTLIIVARDSMLSDLETLLQENGVKAYTIMSNVMGKGVTGRVLTSNPFDTVRNLKVK